MEISNTDGFPRIDDDDAAEEATTRNDAYLERYLLKAWTILLAGPVTDKMARDCMSRLLAMEQMDPERAIKVMINSPGGSADSGFAIYDMLRFVRPPIYTVVNGLCASAGILLQLAAEKGRRFSLPESRFMIHQPSTTGYGTASDLDITAQEVIKLRQRYGQIIATAAGKDPEILLNSIKRDFWLNANEACEYGLVDKVIDSHADMPE